jgi:hypothetical protein
LRFQEKKLVNENGKHPFSRLINTVIFSQEGKQPITCDISGSDLNNNTFFVCWDPNLIPKENSEPHIIMDFKGNGNKGEIDPKKT